MQKYRFISLFAGIGGIDLGFMQAGFQVVWSNEIDKSSALTFKMNHPNTLLVVDDIKNITASDLPNFEILGGGFPCQAFSVAGYKKGFEDERGSLFFQIIRIIEELDKEGKKPKVVFLENVKNLYTHDNKKTYIKMKQSLENNGYTVFEKVLNTCDYGNLPQNRERLYIVAFLDSSNSRNFIWPEKIPLTNTIEKVIDWSSKKVDKKYFYSKDCKSYALLNQNIINKHSIYQYRRVYVRENKSKLCPTLTANMGTGGHNVPIIRDDKNNIRKLTPKECLLLQGFPEDFVIPQELSDSKIYKQVGNSVSISVVARIAENILKALKGD